MKYIKFNNTFQNDGFSFENLVGHLLAEEYGEVFKHTLLTNDGGKDFESKDNSVLSNNQKIWAECKKYAATLSYNDVTKTLLMAYVKSINKVLIFSFSPVNRRFHKSIAEYILKTGIEVKVYDDDILEHLLLKYVKKDWFSSYLYIEEEEDVSASSYPNILCQYGLSKQYRLNTISKKTHVNMHEVFYLELLLTNKSFDFAKVHIDLKDIENNHCFELLDASICNNNYEKDILVPACTSHLFRIRLRIIRFQETYFLPKLKVNGREYKIRKKLYTNWLAEIPILHDASQFELSDCFYYFENNEKLSVICLEGESGVGKSKYLLEIHHESLRYDKQSFYLDIDTKEISFKSLCQELVSFFSKLPLFCKQKKHLIKILDFTTEDNALLFATRILYDPTFDFTQVSDEFVKFLFHYLEKTATTIIFDNIQRYDSLAIELLDKLIILSTARRCPSTLVLSFNTTYLNDSIPASQLKNKLDILSIRKPKQFYCIKLKGFDLDIARVFIQKCLELDIAESHKYSIFINHIINTAGLNPLALQQYLIYLKRKKIVDIRNHQLIIKNPGFIFEEKTLAFNDFSYIFSFNDEYLCKVCKFSLNDYFQLVGFLSICKRVPEKICLRMITKPKVLEQMVTSGLIIYCPDDRTYLFKHSEIKRYYKNKYGLTYMNIPTILDILKSSIGKERYIEQIFLLEMEADTINTYTIDVILRKICAYEMDFENKSEIFYNVLELVKYDLTPSGLSIILILKKITDYCTNYFGIEKSLDYYQKAYQIIKCCHMSDSAQVQDIISIFKEYLRHLLNTGQITDCRNLIFEMLKFEKNLPTIYRVDFKAALYKIQLLVDYKTGNTSKAIETLNLIRKLKFQNKNVLTETYAESLMLMGNIYYKSAQRDLYIKDIISNWENGYSLSEIQFEDFFEISSEKKSVFLHLLIRKILAELIQYQTIKSIDILKQLEGLMEQTGMIYFEVKIRHLLAICYLFDTNSIEDNVKKATSLTKETLEILCTQYGNKYLYATSCFILAEINKNVKNYTQMYYYFLNFYGIFSQVYFKEGISDNDNYMLFEMVLSLRMFKTEISDTFNANLLNNIANNELHDKLMQILYMSDTEFDAYYKKNNCQSLLYDPQTGCNYPLI